MSTILLILTWKLRYPQRRGVNRKRGGVLEVALPGRRQMTYLGEGRVWLGDQGYGETIQINYKMNFIQDSCQRFSLHFKSTLHWLLQLYCITQKCVFLKNYLFLGSFFSVMRHSSSVLFCLKRYMLWTKLAHQSANFQTCDCSRENWQNSLWHFSFFLMSLFIVLTHNSSVMF